MSAILTPVLLVAAIGFVLAVILTIASKVFFVPVDETVAQRRADKLVEFFARRRGNAEFAQGIRHRIGDAFTVVGQRAVQVKKNGVKAAHKPSQ